MDLVIEQIKEKCKFVKHAWAKKAEKSFFPHNISLSLLHTRDAS